MVWKVCRQVLPNSSDAEDAFQAIFLLLVRYSGHGSAWMLSKPIDEQYLHALVTPRSQKVPSKAADHPPASRPKGKN